MSRKRKKMNARSSRRQFRRTAGRTHKRNVSARPMRGGLRL